MATNPTVTTRMRIIDLNLSLLPKKDQHILRTLLLEMLNDYTTLANKLDQETALTNKTYTSGVLTTYR